MELSHNEITPGTVVIRVAGKVMMGAESEQITNLVGDLLQQGKTHVIFEISGITAIDSTGIGRFISSYNQIAAVNGDMRIAAAPGFVARVFHVCRLDTIFRFHPTLEDACKPE
jgi:anti-anti-sigma factor